MLTPDDLPAVVPASRANLDTIATLLADSYKNHPVSRWIIPLDSSRPGLLRAWYLILIEHALTHGAVDMLADRSGAAVWLDHTAAMSVPVGYEYRVSTACGEPGLDMVLADHIGGHHRFPMPHYRLTHLGATGGQYDQQRLSVLLDYRHSRLDRAGVPAAAEACTSDEQMLLTRHGYRSSPQADAYDLPAGPLIRPLLRPVPDGSPRAYAGA